MPIQLSPRDRARIAAFGRHPTISLRDHLRAPVQGATMRGFQKGISFNLADEIAGLLRGPEARDEVRRLDSEAEKKHPWLFMGGEALGEVTSMFAPGAGLASKAVQKLSPVARVGAGAGIGAGVEGSRAFAGGEGGSGPRLQESALPTAIGAAAGGAAFVPGAVKALREAVVRSPSSLATVQPHMRPRGIRPPSRQSSRRPNSGTADPRVAQVMRQLLDEYKGRRMTMNEDDPRAVADEVLDMYTGAEIFEEFNEALRDAAQGKPLPGWVKELDEELSGLLTPSPSESRVFRMERLEGLPPLQRGDTYTFPAWTSTSAKPNIGGYLGWAEGPIRLWDLTAPEGIENILPRGSDTDEVLFAPGNIARILNIQQDRHGDIPVELVTARMSPGNRRASAPRKPEPVGAPPRKAARVMFEKGGYVNEEWLRSRDPGALRQLLEKARSDFENYGFDESAIDVRNIERLLEGQ